ncbi:MAG TPA: hypothetical protein VMH38_08840, partial [Thermoplasmata archaeon]|nr:hypothetical protein [Thermoplasmata archaeon]
MRTLAVFSPYTLQWARLSLNGSWPSFNSGIAWITPDLTDTTAFSGGFLALWRVCSAVEYFSQSTDMGSLPESLKAPGKISSPSMKARCTLWNTRCRPGISSTGKFPIILSSRFQGRSD